jgi:hypothetical protein
VRDPCYLNFYLAAQSAPEALLILGMRPFISCRRTYNHVTRRTACCFALGLVLTRVPVGKLGFEVLNRHNLWRKSRRDLAVPVCPFLERSIAHAIRHTLSKFVPHNVHEREEHRMSSRLTKSAPATTELGPGAGPVVTIHLLTRDRELSLQLTWELNVKERARRHSSTVLVLIQSRNPIV